MKSPAPLRFLLTIALTLVFLPMLVVPVHATDSDGTLDAAFTTATGAGFNNSVFSVAVQADGKIVVGGAFTTLGGVTVNRIARLNADGTRDAAFTTNTGTGFNNLVLSVAVQADGKIVVGGQFTALSGVTANNIARLNPDGAPDAAFTTATGAGFNNSVFSVAVQADGKIVVGGAFTTLGGVTVNRIARLNADGTRDAAFTTNTGTGFNSTVLSVAVQADGKIVVGGQFTALNGVTVNGIARLNPDGTPDTAFTTNTGTGFTGTGFPSYVGTVAVQADGKIVVGGAFNTLNGVTVNGIARLGRSITPTDPSMWTSYRQALPMPASGFCSDITAEQNTFAAYNTGVTGGWVKGWEPWVDNNTGGFACWRNLVNTGGNNWRTTSTP